MLIADISVMLFALAILAFLASLPSPGRETGEKRQQSIR
jgi:hypothetical protein